MQNMLKNVESLFEGRSAFCHDGEVSREKLASAALAMDSEFLNILSSKEETKEHFFSVSGQYLVFDKVKFQRFISNKNFLPDSFTQYKNKIGLVSGDDYIVQSQEVSLVWPFKDCILEGGAG